MNLACIFRPLFTMEKSTLATNRKAYYEYHILETYEAGIQLLGSEVKSIREGNASLKESYVLIRKGQAWLKNTHIAAYSHTGIEGHAAVRDRKLLLHKKEISRIGSKLAEKGLTSVPSKLEIGLAKGKKLHDKRDSKKKRDVERDIQRALNNR